MSSEAMGSAMSFHITTQQIALVFMLAGCVSLVLNEPLARLDTLVVKGGPFRMEQDRMRVARTMITSVGVALLGLAVALVAVR
jgi:hypothetical protein